MKLEQRLYDLSQFLTHVTDFPVRHRWVSVEPRPHGGFSLCDEIPSSFSRDTVFHEEGTKGKPENTMTQVTADTSRVNCSLI